MTMHSVADILRASSSLRSGDPAAVAAIVQRSLALAGIGAPTPLDTQAAANPDATGPRAALQPAGDATAVMAIIEQSLARAGLGAAGQGNPRSLGTVVDALRSGRMELNLPTSRAPVPDVAIPDGAAFLDRTVTAPAGARRYRLYVPSTAGDGLQGLVVMLHGCSQNPEDFATGTGMNALAERHRVLVAYPAQTGGDNAMACWNWFRPGDQRRGSGEPAILAAMAEEIRAEYGLPRDRVFVAGLSAGGAMAAILGATYPDVFAGVGVHSGLPPGAASDMPSAFAAMRGQGTATSGTPSSAAPAPRLIVVHGTADATVHPANARQIIAGHADGSSGGFDRQSHAPAGVRPYTRLVARGADGRHDVECWMIDGAGHAWAGGRPGGSYTDPAGPDASAAMLRFFLAGDGHADA